MALRWRRRGLRARSGEPLTLAAGGLAGATILALAGGELARVWRRGSAPLPAEADDVVAAAGEAAGQAVEVALAGYRDVSMRENAVFNLLGAFTLTFGTVRLSTLIIRSRGRFGPFRDVRVGHRHIHHFVPGIGLALVSGVAAFATRDAGRRRWLALPFGAGAALTLDESALLLELDDVYWTEEGIVSVQITLAATALLGGLTLALRFLRRGEHRVLEAPAAGG